MLNHLRQGTFVESLLKSDPSPKHQRQAISRGVACHAPKSERGRVAPTSSAPFKANIETRLQPVKLDEADEFIDWLFESAWRNGERMGVVHSWMRSPATLQFYKSILQYSHDECGVIALHLDRNGERVAGCVCLLSASVEVLIAGWDDSHAERSPIDILRDELVRFAHAAQKDLDFRSANLVKEYPMANLTEQRASYVLSVGARAQAAWLLGKIGSAIRGAGPRGAGRLQPLART